MERDRKGGIVGIIITIIILIMLVIFSNVNSEKITSIENVASTIVMPIENGLTYLKNKINNNDKFFQNVNELKTENESLKQKNSELEQSLRELENIKTQNETLKEYVNLKDKYTEYTTIPGYVINKNTSNYSNIIVINIGKNDGVDVGMPVIADAGLVGHIISVTDTTAKVQTLLDTSSAVSSVVGTARDSVIIKGNLENSNMLKGTYIPTSAALLEGDKVETSGLGGIYPKGITIGTVKQIIETKNLTNRYILVEPAVNFDKLETVLVIIK